MRDYSIRDGVRLDLGGLLELVGELRGMCFGGRGFGGIGGVGRYLIRSRRWG